MNAREAEERGIREERRRRRWVQVLASGMRTARVARMIAHIDAQAADLPETHRAPWNPEALRRTLWGMSAQPSEGPHELIRPDDQVIRVGGQEAAVVSLDELRMLRALKLNASPEAIEEAEIAADIEAHRAYVAAGSPGAEPHEKVRAELLAELGL